MQPGLVQSPGGEIFPQEPAVVDEDQRQRHIVRDLHPQLGRRGRLLGRHRQHGQLAGVFQNGVFHIGHGGNALLAQLLQQLVQGIAVFGHGRLLHLPVSDQHGGGTAHQLPEAEAAQRQLAQQHGKGQQCQNGDDAGEQRNAEILHGHGGQV